MSENEKKDEKKFEVKADESRANKGKAKMVIGILIALLVLIAVIVGVKFCLTQNGEAGRIEFTLVDQSEFPIVGAEINLSKENGDNIGKVKSGADGKINYYNVKDGKYVIDVINMPEGYEIAEEFKNVDITVEDEKTTNVTLTGKRNIGALKIVVKDQDDKLMENIEVNFSNDLGVFIDKLVTNEDGVIYYTIPENGLYHFDLATNQEIAGRYLIDTTLYRIVVDDENKTFVKELRVKEDVIENVIAEESKNIVAENVVTEK